MNELALGVLNFDRWMD